MSGPTRRGWHEHPDDRDGVLRWFDGKAWTDRTIGKPTGRERTPAPIPEPVPVPSHRGWHDHPDDPTGVQRWFDGTVWTDRTTGRSRPPERPPAPTGDIWQDQDVRRIISTDNGVDIKFYELTPADGELVFAFVQLDQRISESGSPSVTLEGLLAGVRAVERLSDPMPGSWSAGWRKFITYQTGCNVQILQAQQPQSPMIRVFGCWVIETLERNGWAPDGGASVLGRMHSTCLAISDCVRLNSASGRFETTGGEEARRFALSEP